MSIFSFSRKVIERESLMKVIDHDLALLDSMISLFGKQAEDSLGVINRALVKGDWADYLRGAHDIKNIGRSVASARLIEHAQELEQIASAKDLELGRRYIPKTVKLLEQASKDLLEIRVEKDRRIF
jgi:HPt (histidine-containing phosphotransfer) domain-containing protein